ncbi:NAD(P)H-dependent oxidoreductase [Streptomyces sp. NBC_00525]|uniref:NAD(P)H-dependent oxidoreductase n=1 Tax=Streptomyces sp. NBC_00525 TaxID=2903660 RepID=UPI002E80B380|nr:NAD(P)H-dependent oxidoreductase [Streptomyces sp. NBC_00525]WUC97176.1 NAD(P)H-dependent oxidoreductase [Streptomyces sp. NBC_00525]
MPRPLVVVAHPNLARSRVNRAWADALGASGAVDVHVLGAGPVEGRIDVSAAQSLLAAHERIILQYPIHWYSAPGILHHWLEQVLERGWAYGPGGHALEGKELGVAVSTWSTAEDYTRTGRYHRTLDELTAAFEAIAVRVGMNYLGGHFLSGIGRVTDEQLVADAGTYLAWATARPRPPRAENRT